MDQQSPATNDARRDELAAAQEHIDALTAQIRALRADRAAHAGPGWNEQEAPTRLRNMLAIIRSVFRRTSETADTLEDVSLHFTGRFDALARFGIRTMTERSVELEDIVRDELLSVGEGDGARTRIAGPAVPLDFRTAPLVGLAVHELVTNSVKFGALMTDGATLAVSWQLEGESGDGRRLRLSWVEANVPVLASAPMRSGFGREFIEQALPYQLKAETVFELKPGGVTCVIRLPLPDDYGPERSRLAPHL